MVSSTCDISSVHSPRSSTANTTPAYVCTDHTGAAQEGMGVCTVDESTAKADSTVYGVYFNVTTSTTAAGPMWWALPVGSETVESETVESPLEILARDNNAVSLPLFSTRSSSDHFGFDANGVVYYYNATLDADVYNWVLCNALDYGSYTYTAIGWAPTADKGGCSSVNLTVVDI